jgi:hypothetical protein
METPHAKPPHKNPDSPGRRPLPDAHEQCLPGQRVRVLSRSGDVTDTKLAPVHFKQVLTYITARLSGWLLIDF